MSEAKPSFDFEKAYLLYPRKEGKTRAFKKLNATIKTQEDYDLFLTALLGYKKMCEDRQTERQFIKHFCTFVNNWQDYLDKSVTEEPKSTNLSQLDRILKGQL